MKRLLCGILLCGAVSGQDAKKPYDNVVVTVTSTWVNAEGVRVIEGRSDRFSFIFSCNADEKTCAAPEVKAEYRLFDPEPATFYKCDEYGMIHAGKRKDFVAVCLKNVSAQ